MSARKHAALTVLIFSIALGLPLIGCAGPKKAAVIRSKNPMLRCEPEQVTRRQMVELINAARSKTRRCGHRRYPAAGAVRWNPQLADAAKRHTTDMADGNRLSHTGTGNTTVSRRVSRAGYRWQVVAENIAAGLETSEEVIVQWLHSPEHCRNIMERNLSEIGAACRRNRSSRYGTYWTLVLGSPIK